MRYFSQFTVLALCLLAAVSCRKGATLLSGSYTYKISGEVGLVATSEIHTPSTKPDTVFMDLVTERGQMNIARDGAADRVVMSWNELTGEVCTARAAAEGSTVTIDASVRKATLRSALLKYEGNVTFSGTGELYDNMLIIPMTYLGEITVAGVPMTIISSDIECVAKANE